MEPSGEGEDEPAILVRFTMHTADPPQISMFRQKLSKFKWDVLPDTAYSSGFALADFHLFQNSLNGVTLNSKKAVNHHLLQFFANKDSSFYERRICWKR